MCSLLTQKSTQLSTAIWQHSLITFPTFSSLSAVTCLQKMFSLKYNLQPINLCFWFLSLQENSSDFTPFTSFVLSSSGPSFLLFILDQSGWSMKSKSTNAIQFGGETF